MYVRFVGWRSQLYHQRLPQVIPGWFVLILLFALPFSAFAGTCGGSVPCQCGDTVTANHTMTYDLGPCPRLSGTGVDTVGLVVQSGVTLDCQEHAIIGPGDTLKNAFGIRVGFRSAPTPATGVTIKNCLVNKFWWGIYVQNAANVVIDSNILRANGWKDPRRNGTGYGLDVANSHFITVRNNVIEDSGNEGFHLSHSTNATIEDNTLSDNGFEQLYLFFADNNIIRNNTASGGRQGLEMRWSNNNAFSYNTWANSPKQWLENHNTNNTFLYDHFHGLLQVARLSTGNRFELCEFSHPTGQCVRINAQGTSIYKGHFSACAFDVRTSAPLTLDRCNGVDKKSGRITAIFPGCIADLDLDGEVDDNDRTLLLAAVGSTIGAANWDPEGDLDHDGDVDGADVALLDTQLGPCMP